MSTHVKPVWEKRHQTFFQVSLLLFRRQLQNGQDFLWTLKPHQKDIALIVIIYTPQ